MERFSLIVVSDETAPIRRFDVKKRSVRNAVAGAAILLVCLVLGLVDYVRVRIDQVELESLRSEAAGQRSRIAGFEQTLAEVEGQLETLREFERKVRIIANLPGASAAGGEDVTAVSPEAGDEAADASELPAGGDEADLQALPVGGPPAAAAPAAAPPDASRGGDRVGMLRRDAERLGLVANARALSLEELVKQLEAKRHHLASTPAIWPTRGWLTSRFGYRTSPFTNSRQFHAAIDIAGARGTEIVAPARGRVTFAGKRGPLGKSLVLDHGYGVRTLYGHTEEIKVVEGQEVERGQVIATLGNSGRSTGPHLHYVVEVDGKARNPLDYIFD
jgi:septal ring factor EnvC (AmiA/AmiB activator)